MPRLTIKVPKYRHHKASGQAVVALGGRDVYLGNFNSPESKAKYKRLIAEWEIRGRAQPPAQMSETTTIDALILAYLKHVKSYYVKNGRPTSSQHQIRGALAPLHDLYGASPVTGFGPLALKALRQSMIDRRVWCRTSINTAIGIVKRLFKWGTENELVPAQIYHALQSVAGLRRGRATVRETGPVLPVPEAEIDAVLPHISRQVRAMIMLQLLTGMRPGEVVAMKVQDLNTTGPVWTFTPASHKTEHHGRGRVIYLGPKAQEVLKPFLKPELIAYLFSPTEALAERQADRRRNRKTSLTPSQLARTRQDNPAWSPGDHYTATAYCRAIHRGCDRAFPPPAQLAKRSDETGEERMERLTSSERATLVDWQRDHRWHPNRLRHNAATRLRREFGIEAARVVLGHSSATVTEVYAELDQLKAADIMKRIG